MSETVVKRGASLSYEPKWTFRAKAGEDKASASIKYKDQFAGWEGRVPYFGSEHPDLRGFKLIEILANREEGDLIAVDLNYEATAAEVDFPGRDPDEENRPRYSVMISSREEHILSNPFAEPLPEAELKALYAIANGTEADEDGNLYEDEVVSAEGVALLEKIRKGNTAYKTGGLIYTERKVTDSLADVDYTQIGKTQNPPGPAGAAAENWLYIGATAEPSDDGESWTLERQWEFSPDGWDEDLYS